MFSAIGFGFGLGNIAREFEEKTEGSDDGKTNIVRKGIKFFDVAALFFIVITVFFGGARKWLILPVLFSLLITALILFSGFLEINLSALRHQIVIIFVLTLLPFQAYGFGRYKAIHIEEGVHYRYVVNEIDGIKTEVKTDLRYLGKAGSSLFVYLAGAAEVLIIELSELSPLRLKTFETFESGSEAKKD